MKRGLEGVVGYCHTNTFASSMEKTLNRLQKLFSDPDRKVLSIYFTAGFPQLDDTRRVLKSLQAAGADLVEIGMPYSDPVADGPTIQDSNQVAIGHGMTIKTLFEQLKGCRTEIDMPLILMGYLNPILQYGFKAFCQQCRETGIDGLIIPDLPLFEYQSLYQEVFEKNGLSNIFLITPQTPDERIKAIDALSEGFIYMVSSASITGARGSIDEAQIAYFERINALNLENPRLIGFGISNHETFETACQYAHGAIVGSAFIKLLESASDLQSDIQGFISGLRG